MVQRTFGLNFSVLVAKTVTPDSSTSCEGKDITITLSDKT